MAALKIAHLASDEKFIDQAMRAFEYAAPGANHLYVCSKTPLKFVRSPSTILHKISILTHNNSEQLKTYDLVIIHSLDPSWYKSISKLPKNLSVVWIGWGYDYYDIIHKTRSEMLLPLTFHALKEKNLLRRIMKKTTHLLKKYFLTSPRHDAIERIDFFSPVLPSEYLAASKKYLAGKFPEYVQWNYGNLEEDLVKGFTEAQVTGNAILVGNSASAENNHLDSFALLTLLGVCNRRIVSPLSYGDAQYRDLVLRNGHKQFGNHFEPLIEFIPICDYVKILESCGFVIMNHIRQQAVGNIVIMLYLGAKVFLRQECPTYTFFRDQGAVIFSIEELEKKPELINDRLSLTSMAINQNVVMNNWSKEVSNNKTINLLRTVCKPK